MSPPFTLTDVAADDIASASSLASTTGFSPSGKAPSRRRSVGRKLPSVPPTSDPITPARARTIRAANRTPKSLLKYARNQLQDTGRQLVGKADSSELGRIPAIPQAGAITTNSVPPKPHRGRPSQGEKASPATGSVAAAEPQLLLSPETFPSATPGKSARRDKRIAAAAKARAKAEQDAVSAQQCGAPAVQAPAKVPRGVAKKDGCAVCGKTVGAAE